MKDFQQRKKIRKYLYSRASVVVLAILTVILLHGAIGVMRKDADSKENLRLAQNEMVIAQKKNDELTKNLALLSTETGVESAIRSKFNVSREGEEVAVIVDSPKASTTAALPQGFWSKVAAWFRNIF